MSTVKGLAVPYNEPTLIPGMGAEVFMGPSPFGDIKTLLTVTAQRQHSIPDVIGSTASGTLRLVEMPDGLHYEIDIPESDPLTAELVQRGDLPGASFAFSVRPGGAKWDTSPGGMAIRIITAADLYEVSLVSTPAYPTTTAMLMRSREPTLSETREALAAANARIRRVREEDADRALGLRQTTEAILSLRDRQTRWHRADIELARARRR
jgi:HK97 family phage prohead protease